MKSQLQTSDWKTIASLKVFLRDRIYVIMLAVASLFTLLLFLLALKIALEVIIVVAVVFIVFVTISLAIEYSRRRYFYQNLLQNLQTLDQAYLILETLEPPNFYEGKILWETLYQANKSMAEHVKRHAMMTKDFREYIELWIHEAKTPLATLTIMNRDPRISEQLQRLDGYLEQVLYYVRAEHAESDYLIKKLTLANVVHNLAMHQREIIQARHIDFSTENLDFMVFSDAKWLEFILGQILTNSIKYGSNRIVVAAAQNQDGDIELEISDNGIGIAEKDLSRIFEKTFTGANGRQADSSRSTGMGLYIVNTLCRKLGHQVSAESIIGQGTTIKIVFKNHDYYHVTNSQ